MAAHRADAALPDEDVTSDTRSRYRELLEEIRTVLPGVQVLFAFLLIAPFSPRFPELAPFERDLYGIALVATALATTLFMAPTSFHRIGARRDRRVRLRIAIGLTVVGMLAMAIAIVSAVLAVLRFVFGAGVATTVTLSLTSVIVLVWYLLPLLSRTLGRPDPGTGAGTG